MWIRASKPGPSGGIQIPEPARANRFEALPPKAREGPLPPHPAGAFLYLEVSGYPSVPFALMATFPARAWLTGHPSLALATASANPGWSIPGTLPVTSR